MRVLHITPYYAPAYAYGGVVRAVTGLARTLAAAGNTVVVLTTDALDRSGRILVREETLEGVLVIRVRNCSNLIRNRFNLSTPLHFGATARQLIRDHAIELVHCHELRTVETLSIAAGGGANLPVVISMHGTLPYRVGRRMWKQAWDRIFSKLLLSRIDQVVALTETEAEEVRSLWASQRVPLRADQVSVVPNGVFPEDFAHLPSGDSFRSQWGLGDGPVVIFLGRLAERKGLQFLIPAFAEASRNLPNARLLLVGPDEDMLSRLKDQAKKNGLFERVVFTGLLTGEDRRAALAASDVFVLPAVGEGFSMAVLEAMACGLPVVLTRECHFPEAASAGAGLEVSREEGSLAETLQALLQDPERRALMGRRARELVRARFSWSRIAGQFEDVYRAAARHRNRINQPTSDGNS